ncbi:MAG: hypothetical protein HC933_02385 [Pleurocapsa sp. SU_196_0]|nr:hypothetical protein [Pleurocapsa sp. SU_196_0]
MKISNVARRTDRALHHRAGTQGRSSHGSQHTRSRRLASVTAVTRHSRGLSAVRIYTRGMKPVLVWLLLFASSLALAQGLSGNYTLSQNGQTLALTLRDSGGQVTGTLTGDGGVYQLQGSPAARAPRACFPTDRSSFIFICGCREISSRSSSRNSMTPTSLTRAPRSNSSSRGQPPRAVPTSIQRRIRLCPSNRTPRAQRWTP